MQRCPQRLLLLCVRLLHDRGGTSFWEDKGAGLKARQLGTSPPCGPGGGRGRGRRPHSPALIFDFEERCFQSGHWKGRVNTLASVCSSAEPALHTQEMLKEARPCQSLRASQGCNTRCPKVRLSIWQRGGSHSHLI